MMRCAVMPALDTQCCAAAVSWVEYRGLALAILPGVFSPRPRMSAHRGPSRRNRELCEGKRVLDVGCGSGIRALLASLAGAREVVACDISPIACVNTALNCRLHGTEVVTVARSDVCAAVEGVFDTIIAYLPSINAPIRTPEDVALHDPQYRSLRCLFTQAPQHLTPGGVLHVSFLDVGNRTWFFAEAQRHGLRPQRVREHRSDEELWLLVDLVVD